MPEVYRDFITDKRVTTLMLAITFTNICNITDKPFETLEFVPGEGVKTVLSADYETRSKILASMVLNIIMSDYPEFLKSSMDEEDDKYDLSPGDFN